MGLIFTMNGYSKSHLGERPNSKTNQIILSNFILINEQDIINAMRVKPEETEPRFFNQLKESIDSEINRAIENKDSIQLIKLYNRLGNLFLRKGNLEFAHNNFQIAYDIAFHFNNCRGQLAAQSNLGNIILIKRDYSKALTVYNKIIDQADSCDDFNPILIFLNIATIKKNLGKPSEALSIFLDARTYFFERSENDFLAKIDLHIGHLFMSNYLYDLALNYFKNSYSYFQKSQDSMSFKHFANLNENIGEIYLHLSDLDSAKFYLDRAQFINRKYNIENTCNLKLLQGRLLLKRKELNSSVLKLNEALKCYQQVKDSISIADVSIVYADLYLRNHNLKKSKHYARRAISIYEKLNIGNSTLRGYQVLSEIYEKQDSLELALNYRKLSEQLSDTIKSPNKIAGLSRIEMMNVLKKKEALFKEKEGTVFKRFIIISTSFIILSIGVLFVKTRRKKVAKRKKILNSIKKREAEILISKLYILMDKDKPYLECDLTIGMLAKQMSINERTLSLLLNHYIRVNFKDFINSYRLNKFNERIKTTKRYSIIGMAYECGFNSKSSFYRAYKKQFGKTPNQFVTSK